MSVTTNWPLKSKYQAARRRNLHAAISFVRSPLFLLLVVLMLLGASYANTWNAFGPQTDQQTSTTPQAVTSSFSVHSTATTYTLVVTGTANANPLIVLNGKTVVSQTDPNISKTVTLALSNTISVTVRGGVGSSVTVTISGVDSDLPTIMASAKPTPNAAGWNNANVTVTFTCADKTSGIASCTSPITVSTDGAGQVIKGTAIDLAGNTASTSVTINLDKTAPTITPGQTPAADSFGWNNTNVTVSFTCTDATSGVKSCTGPTTLAGQGANQAVKGTAIDNAGNTATASDTVNIDKTAPTISSTATPAPNAAGWNNTNVAVAFTCSDALSGVATCPPTNNVSTEGLNQTIAGTAVDKAGNTANTSRTVSIDKTAPTITTTLSPVPNAAGWNKTNVNATFSCTDNLSGVASCPAATSVTIEGANQSLPGTATDKAGNSSSPTTKVSIDKTPPTISSTATPAPNGAGWNNTNVVVAFTCSDALSGVATCPATNTVSTEGLNQSVSGTAVDVAGNAASTSRTVSIDKTPPTITTALSPLPNGAGWNNTNVNATFSCTDTLSGVASCPTATSITTEGANQNVPGTATDKAGNTAIPSTKVNIDKTPPSIAAALSPLANSFGWNNTSVTVNFTCTDALSGIASCASPVSFTHEGAGQTANGSATDIAGNTSSTGATVNIDETPPTISAAIVPGPNAAGWNNTNITATFTCTDSLSGVASCPAATTVTTEGANQSLSGIGTDKAGNTSTPSTKVNIDKTPPTIAAVLSPLANAFGWNNTSVTVNFTCADSLSGVANCASPVSITHEGSGQSATGSASDVAGNTSNTSATVNIDETAPTITAAVAPAPNAAGWNNGNVTVTFNCADSLSGIAACAQQQSITTEGTNQVTGIATDKAGNSASTSVNVNIDRTPPSVTPIITPSPNAAGWNNTNVTITFTCNDAGSGVALCPAPIQVNTEGANQVFSFTATDVAGNTATGSLTLNIDKTPPVITPTAAPPPNAGGWNNSPVTVTFQCSDSLSGVAVCPPPQVVNTQGVTSPFQTVTGTATDIAGNTASASVTIELETSSPTITASAAPPANAAGWNNSDVTVSFQCTQALAPITSCPQQQVVSTEGANQSVSGTVTDAAGNTASTSVTLNIDKTPPIINGTVSPPPNANGIVTASSATVTFSCSDALSGVAICPPPVTVTTNGPQNITGTAFDIAGNSASTSAQFTLQNFPPLHIIASASPTPNAAGWNNAPVTVTFLCSGGAPPVSCPAPQIVNTDGAAQVVSGTATDNAGSQASASVTINLDQTPPLVSITSPTNGSITPSASVPVTGLTSDGLSGLASVSCNGTPATLSGGSFNCTLQITQGSLVINVQATDVAGNNATSSVTANLQGPKLTITSPAPLDLFAANPISVTGTVDDPNATISVSGVAASNNGGTFTAQGVIVREGSTLITATATNAGGAVGTASVNVILDTTPPIVTINSPSDKAVVTSPQVYVTGLVNDVVPGTVNSSQVSVTVNGVKADVANRSFMAEDVLLVPGQNVITAVAKDRAGNVSQSSITVTLLDAATQQRILMVSGNGQSAPAGTILTQPLVVEVVNGVGQPVPNVPLTFSVNKSDGQLTAFPQQGRQIVVQTDANGQASVNFQLGTRVGNGNNQVLVTSPGFVGEVMFCSTSTVGAPTQVHDIAGENQKGVIGQALPEPLVVVVFDAGSNPVAGVPVVFKVQQGGGTLEGQTTVTKTTDSDGRASVSLTLAQEEGINNNVVSASFVGLANPPALFTASGVTPGNPTNTTVSGIVLDNASQPVPNATASIQGTNLTALTDSNGRFTISNAPVGSINLFVDGSTTTDSEVYPFLEFPMVTVAGQDNNLGKPIFLPGLDTDNSQVVGGDEDVTLTMKGVPGVVFTVFAHSATFPDGSKVGKLSVSQVHADKLPMKPTNGAAPRLLWTVQPPRVKFNPPARIQIPNTDGLAPGAVTEIFCYNHDLEEFASGGTARVSEDGSVIVSDPGSGVIVSGWGDAAPPPPPKSCGAKPPADDQCGHSVVDQDTCTVTRVIDEGDGALCDGKPGADSTCRQWECKDGYCQETNLFSIPQPEGLPCDDGLFCTGPEPDHCDANGKCVGKKLDPPVGFPRTIQIQTPGMNVLVDGFQQFLSVAKLGNFSFSPKIDFTAQEETDMECCEEKKGAFTTKDNITGNVSISYEGPELFVPVPPWSGDFTVSVLGVNVGAKWGAFVQPFIEVSGQAGKEENECLDKKCWTGSVGAAAGLKGGIKVEVPNPFIDGCGPSGKDECQIASAELALASSVEFKTEFGCKEFDVVGNWQGVVLQGQLTLLDGTPLKFGGGFKEQLFPPQEIFKTSVELPLVTE